MTGRAGGSSLGQRGGGTWLDGPMLLFILMPLKFFESGEPFLAATLVVLEDLVPEHHVLADVSHVPLSGRGTHRTHQGSPADVGSGVH